MKRLQIIADHREFGVGKRPWSFDADRFDTARGHLLTGDYSPAGYEDRIAVERKALGDWVRTVTADWLRFRRELYRLAAMDAALIVVEADTRDVWQRKYEEDADPASIIGRANAVILDHGVPVLFAGPPEFCVPVVEGFMAQAVKKLGGGR